jgi:putative endopeptidase
LETRFAEVSRSLEQLEDPEKNYNLMTLAQVDALTPGVSWAPVLQRMKAPVVKQLVVGQPEFFQGFAKILATTPPPILRDYLRFHTMTAYAAILNGQTSQDNFAFTGVVLSGAKQQRSLEDRALALQDRTIGDLVGEEYVARRFGPAQRERFRLVCEGVRTAFAKRLVVNPWMDAPTREWALKKLAAVKLRVGYTDKFRQFDGVRITSDSLAENVLAVDQWETRRAYARVGGAPEREEWGMRPYTVNAYYNPLNNEIVLPAAILTVPAYAGNDLDDAVLYGYIATTIGHEITHGFDDSGRRFSATGRMENGWTPATEQAYAARCAQLIAQYDREEPLKGIRINGKQTLSENIADLGGVALALDAFQQTETYKSGKLIAGQTPLQRFFLAYAFSFAGNIRDEQLATRLLSDTHSPAQARINVIVRNLDAYHEAFGSKPSDPMYLDPKERVRIW